MDIFRHETWINGLYLGKKEQDFYDSGRDFLWDRKEFVQGEDLISFYNEKWQKMKGDP